MSLYALSKKSDHQLDYAKNNSVSLKHQNARCIMGDVSSTVNGDIVIRKNT